jgi:hypothetical protein
VESRDGNPIGRPDYIINPDAAILEDIAHDVVR